MSDATSVDPSAGSADASSAGEATGTTSAPPTDESTSDSATASDADTGEDPKRPEHEYVANNDHDTCTQPLWCYSGAITSPTGATSHAQDCFTPSLPPPFEITHIHYTVANAGATPIGMVVEIMDRAGNQPGNIVTSFNLGANMSAPGSHIFELPEPILWTQSSFCAGLYAPSGYADQAVGIALDTTNTVPGVSWLRMFGSGACSIPSWADAAASGFTPSGNWCIAATIREAL